MFIVAGDVKPTLWSLTVKPYGAQNYFRVTHTPQTPDNPWCPWNKGRLLRKSELHASAEGAWKAYLAAQVKAESRLLSELERVRGCAAVALAALGPMKVA